MSTILIKAKLLFKKHSPMNMCSKFQVDILNILSLATLANRSLFKQFPWFSAFFLQFSKYSGVVFRGLHVLYEKLSKLHASPPKPKTRS